MKFSKRLAAGVAILPVVAVVGVAAPASAINLPSRETVKDMVRHLDVRSNAAVSVETELNCSTHMITAKVTNNLDKPISPKVTFNDEDPTWIGPDEIKAGQTASYFWAYTGNNVLAVTQVSVDGYDPVILKPTINCAEPVTFRMTDASESTVVGMLTNNSSFVGQTVFLRVGMGDIRTESLSPGESRLVSVPFDGYDGQLTASLSIGTAYGYDGSYIIDLTGGVVIPLGK